MFAQDARSNDALDMAGLLDILAQSSQRPRYTFMLLSLIAQVARPDGSAGPTIAGPEGPVPLRDWLCDALAPMAARDPRRRALIDRVEAELQGQLPDDPAQAAALRDEAVQERMRTTGKTAISRAVSELVAAGLMRRHYQGYRVDHANRGAQRHAVYSLARPVQHVLTRPAQPRPAALPRQAELAL